MRQRGITLVEIMVAVALVGIAAAFTFGIQVRTSSAFRDQTTVAELQQTLRAVSDLLVRDIRATGYRAKIVRLGPAPTIDHYSITVADGAGGYGSDVLTVQYGDDSKLAHVASGAAFTPTTSVGVESTGGFVTGDVAVVSARSPTGAPTARSVGCVLALTTVNAGPPATLSFVTQSPWNSADMTGQCALLPTASWTEGFTTFTRAVLRSYRIRPGDVRGVLEMSPSAQVVANDWQPLAVGIVDLQVAIRVYQPGDATDDDLDGDATRDWLSGTNMDAWPPAGNFALAANAQDLLQVSVTVVAKSSKEVGGATLSKSPDVFETGKPLANNSIGNHAGTNLPVTDTTSPFYGDFLYRSYTSTVDLRNVGVGN